MKKIKLLAFVSMFILGGAIAFAQEIGHIDSQALLDAMPEKVSADSQLKALVERHQAEIKKQEEAIQKIIEDVQKETQNKTQQELQAMEANLKAKEAEYQNNLQKLQQYRQAADQELNQKSEQLYTPINKKAQDAINKVAAQKGLKYVLDSQILLYENGTDIMPDVKKELGIK